MRCQDHQNDSVATQPILKITSKRHKLVSPTGDESISCQPMPILPEELILEILLRVRVKSLLRFRCVCKSWKTLISDPEFAKEHLRTSIADPNMTHQRSVSPILGNPRQMVFFSVQSLLRNPSTPAKPSFYFKTRSRYRVLGSCNGLLCMFNVYHRYVRLWNPAIRVKSKILSIGGGPDSEITYHGFGYDHVNDKYKLLLALKDLRDHETVTKIYSFGENSCTVIPNFPCHPTRMQGNYVSGTLNWIVKGGVSHDDQWVIFSLDIATETYGEVLLPDGDGDHKTFYPVLGVSRNCLCVYFFDSKTAHWVVWLMKEYGVQHSWTKFMAIPHVEDTLTELTMISQDQPGICRWHHSLDPLCISENGVVLVKTKFYKLVLYNSNDGRVDDRRIRKELGVDYLQIYHESLISPRR